MFLHQDKLKQFKKMTIGTNNWDEETYRNKLENKIAKRGQQAKK